MSYRLDQLITQAVPRDWCGCPIVMDITAHVCGITSLPSVDNSVDSRDGYADWLDAPAGYEG